MLVRKIAAGCHGVNTPGEWGIFQGFSEVLKYFAGLGRFRYDRVRDQGTFACNSPQPCRWTGELADRRHWQDFHRIYFEADLRVCPAGGAERTRRRMMRCRRRC